MHLSRCTWIIAEDGQPKQFKQTDQDHMITNLIEPMANDALRTICIAYKDFVPSNRLNSAIVMIMFYVNFEST